MQSEIFLKTKRPNCCNPK